MTANDLPAPVPAPTEEGAAPAKRRGRPAGKKNAAPKKPGKRGRPAGSKSAGKRGRPAGKKAGKRGRPAGSARKNRSSSYSVVGPVELPLIKRVAAYRMEREQVAAFVESSVWKSLASASGVALLWVDGAVHYVIDAAKGFETSLFTSEHLELINSVLSDFGGAVEASLLFLESPAAFDAKAHKALLEEVLVAARAKNPRLRNGLSDVEAKPFTIEGFDKGAGAPSAGVRLLRGLLDADASSAPVAAKPAGKRGRPAGSGSASKGTGKRRGRPAKAKDPVDPNQPAKRRGRPPKNAVVPPPTPPSEGPLG